MRLLKKRTLEELSIILPDLAHQRKIGEYYTYALQELKLQRILHAKRFLLNNELLMQVAYQHSKELS